MSTKQSCIIDLALVGQKKYLPMKLQTSNGKGRFGSAWHAGSFV
jgi:hypothetical protein